MQDQDKPNPDQQHQNPESYNENTAPGDDLELDEFYDTDEDLDYLDEQEESWNEEDYQNLNAVQEAKRKKFNKTVILLAVLAGLGTLIFQVATKKPKDTRFQTALEMEGSLAGPVFGQPDKTEPPPTEEASPSAPNAEQADGFLDNPNLIPTDREITSAEDLFPSPEEAPLTPLPDGMSETATESADLPRAPDNASAQNPAEGTGNAEALLKAAISARKNNKTDMQNDPASDEEPVQDPAEDLSDLPVAEPVLAITEETEETEESAFRISDPAADIPDPVTEDISYTASEDEKLTLLTRRIEALEDHLARMEESEDKTLSDLRSTIEDLRKDITESGPSETIRKPEQSAKESQSGNDTPQQDTAPVSAPPPSPKPRASPAASPAPMKTVQPESFTAGWMLRAAQPGRAWVSRQGEQDMHSIQVGDRLTGIGRITAISFENGRWRVQGTQGRILQ